MTKNTSIESLTEELKIAKEQIKMMESRLVQAGKVAALGQLSAGIAHELKQPLTGILGFAEDALEETKDNEAATESINVITREAERMRKIVDGIRKFSRSSGTEKNDIDIDGIIEDALLLLSKQLANNNIVLKRTLGEDLPQVHGNASQLQQVFVNMTSNAKDALEEQGGGDLTVKSELSQDGKYVEVSFQDTGCGMPQEVIEKLSEPFFTTKGADKGTGLGTSISFTIIKEHGGNIDIKSVVGTGTTITISIPITA